MTLDDLRTFIGSLTNDPAHDRYSLTDIGTELDNTMDRWNVEAKIIKDTSSTTLVAGTRQYAMSALTGTPIAFTRATHRGLLLNKRSKSYFDLYLGSGVDWTSLTGTPTDYFVEATDPDLQYLTVYPTPTSVDTDVPLVNEYIKRHTSMSATSDTPFMSGTTANYLMRPYDWGLGYETAAKLLARDPSPGNSEKSANYAKVASGVLSEVIQVYKNLEQPAPDRIVGGRYWNSGYVRTVK